MVLVKQQTRALPDGRKWYVKMFKTKEGYYLDYDTEDGAGESHHYPSRASALRRFKKEARSLNKIIIGVRMFRGKR